MGRHYNLWSFYLILISLGLALWSLFFNVNGVAWQIAPPNYILLIMGLLAFALGIVGFKDKRNWRTKTRSWLTVTLSSMTTIALVLIISLSSFFASMDVNEHIKTVSSPDGHYKIDFYHFDAGATGSFGIRGVLNGPLWVKKRIYLQEGTDTVDVHLLDNDIVSINNHRLNLADGETYGY